MSNYCHAQTLQLDRIFTLEMTIELLVALLQSRINSPDIHGQITPERISIDSVQPLKLQILPADLIHADPEFSAPEILDGKSSSSSDVYSIGLVIIYFLTGIRPFQLFDTATQDWVWQDYWQPSIQSSRINHVQLAAILDRSINLDPNLRFNSAAAMMAAVKDCIPNLPPILPNWTCRHTLTGHQGLFAAIRSISISPHLPLVATGSEDTTIRLWNVDTGAEIGILTGHQKSVESIAFHPQHTGLLVSGDRSGMIKLWQANLGAELISINSQQGKVNSLAISPDGELMISGGSDKTIKIWGLGGTEPSSIEYLATLKAHQLAVNAVAFNPIEGEVKFASVGSDRKVILWAVDSKTPLAILTAHTQAVKTLAFSPDSKLLATAGDDGSIMIWDLDNRILAKALSAHRWTISSLSFLADNNTLISASWDGNIKFWQVDLGTEIDCLITHAAEVLGMDICPRRQLLVTASQDRTAKIWHPSRINL